MAEYGRSAAHWLLLSLVIGGLWLYADAKRRANGKPLGTWKDAKGVVYTGNPYAPPDPQIHLDAVASASASETLEP